MDPNSAVAQPVVAVFDFDGTMTTVDSLRVFLRSATGAVRYWSGLVILSPRFLQYVLGMLPAWRMKEIVLTYFFAGWREERLRAAAESFAATELPNLVKPAALKRLRWHQQQKHRTILISASPELYLRPWAAALGFNGVSCTRLATEQGVVTGRILGKNCAGPEKVERLRQLLADTSQYFICAYGDSRADEELLALANQAHYRPF